MTKNALIYPQYLPERTELRVNLLLNDSVSTIVPDTDQAAVLRRPQICELLDEIPQGSFRFVDPTHKYNQWLGEPEAMARLKKITDPIISSPSHNEMWYGVGVDDHGRINEPQLAHWMKDKLRRAEWVYLATQKVPPDLLSELFEKRLAVRVRSLHHEAFPVLVHPRVGGFILSQLARTISADEKLRMVTSDSYAFKDSLFEPNSEARLANEQILSVIINLTMPKTISNIKPSDFAYARDNFAAVRNNISEIISSITGCIELDSERDVAQFREACRDRASDLKQRVDEAQRALKWDQQWKRVSFGLNLVAAAAGGAIGAAYGNVLGGAVGAVVGFGVVPVVGAVTKLSTSTVSNHNQGILRLASVKTNLDARGRTMGILKL